MTDLTADKLAAPGRALVPSSSPGTMSPAEWDMIKSIAAAAGSSTIANAVFKGRREDAMIALLCAHGLGLHPAVAVMKGFVINGRFGVEADVLLGMVQAREPRFDYEVLELSDRLCTVKGWMKGKTPHLVTFTLEQAKAANLTDKDNWRNWGQDMLFSKAVRRMLKRVAPHALYNMPVILEERDEAEPPQSEAPEPPQVPADEPMDRERTAKDLFLERSAAAGIRGKTALLSWVNGIMKAVGRVAVRNAEQLSEDDWEALWTEVKRRYDEQGRYLGPVPRVGSSVEEILEGAAEQSGAEAGGSRPDRSEAAPETEEPPPPVETGTEAAPEPNPWKEALEGDPTALARLCRTIEQSKKVVLLAHGVFKGGGAPPIYFVHHQVLTALGLCNDHGPVSQKLFGGSPGKPAASSNVLAAIAREVLRIP